MKIGIVCYPTFGGSGVVATELGLQLSKSKYEVHFITYKQPVRLEIINSSLFFHEVNVPDYPLFHYQPYELALSSKLVDTVKKYNIDAKYQPLKAEEISLESITNKIRNNELAGINVTLPFKQKIIPFVDQLINDAKITNSINTIYLGQNNTLIGENTDVFGLQAAYLKEITQTENKKALVIGAGGVSSSVIFSLEKSKVKDISVSYTHLTLPTSDLV